MQAVRLKETHCGSFGQILISDFVVSLIVFVILLMLIHAAWMRSISAMGEELELERAAQAAQKGMDALVLSPGFPSNWAARNLQATDQALQGAGVADGPGNVDGRKMARLSSLLNDAGQHNATLKKMGIAPYDGDAQLSYLNGTPIYSAGFPPQSDAEVLSSAQRLVTYANESARMRIRVWRANQ